MTRLLTNGEYAETVVSVDADGNIAAAGGGGGGAATIANGADVAEGSTTDAPGSSTVAEDTTARTGVSLWKAIKNILILIKGVLDAIKAKTDNIPAQGQALSGASLPVVLPAAQITTLTPPAAITGFSTSAQIGEVQASPTANTLLDRLKALLTGIILAAGENHVGAIGGNATVVTVTPTLTVHATYAAGDFVGTSTTPMTFAGCARVNAGTGKITGAVLIDYALQSVAGELWLFDATVTPPADSAAWSISDADSLKCIGVIPFGVYCASALNSVSPVPNLSIPFKAGAGATALYGCFVTRGAPAYASGDISFRLFIDQD